jgi:capsular polysaccharide biosynthesis protein
MRTILPGPERAGAYVRSFAMEIQAYVRILRRRGWIILLTALVAAAAALGFSRFQQPIYRARILVSVLPARADWGLSNSTKDLLRNFQTQLLTHRMAQRVIDQAQLDMNSYELLAEVEANPEPDRFLIEIVAKDADPRTAITIVQTMAQLFVDEREAWNQEQDKRDRIDVSIVDNARDAPLWRPNLRMNLLVGLLLGALAGAFIVFGLEWLEADILRTPEDVERVLGLSVLGAIPPGVGASTRPARLARVRRALPQT